MPTVGAVVVNYNGGDRILRCLEALRGQTAPLAEIVVVDNGSTDGSLERVRARHPGVRVLPLGENRGLPAARNAGLGELRTDLAFSVDSDVYPAPDCLALLLEAWRQDQPAVVCPRIVLLPGRDLIQCDGASLYFLGTLALRHAYQPASGVPPEGRFVGGCIGACLLLRRDLILEAGGFNELFFFYFEDLELSLKLRARGHRLFCEPRAIAYHDPGSGTPGLSYRGTGAYPARRAYLSMRHRWLAMLIHYRIRTLMILGPALGLYELGTLGFAVRRGWLGAWARAWIWLIGHQREIRSHRRVAQASRTTSDRELLEAGPIPVAPGLLGSAWSRRAAGLFSRLFQGYWTVVRRLVR